MVTAIPLLPFYCDTMFSFPSPVNFRQNVRLSTLTGLITCALCTKVWRVCQERFPCVEQQWEWTDGCGSEPTAVAVLTAIWGTYRRIVSLNSAQIRRFSAGSDSSWTQPARLLRENRRKKPLKPVPLRTETDSVFTAESGTVPLLVCAPSWRNKRPVERR